MTDIGVRASRAKEATLTKLWSETLRPKFGRASFLCVFTSVAKQGLVSVMKGIGLYKHRAAPLTDNGSESDLTLVGLPLCAADGSAVLLG